MKYLVLLTYPKQLLVFEKCALCDLKYSHVNNSETSDLLRVTCVALNITKGYGIPMM